MNLVFSQLYAAASGRLNWTSPLHCLSETLGLWAAQLVAVDKRSGRLSFHAEGGPVSAHAALDYIRYYRALNPCLVPSRATPVGKWMHCHEHIDETFVAKSPYYQDFLIPHGGRYLTAMKLIDDAASVVMLGLLRGIGSRPFTDADDEVLEALQHHASEALRNFLHLRATFAELGIARDLLGHFKYPMMLLDETLGIAHRNDAAQAILDVGDPVQERAGSLTCHDSKNCVQLTEVIRDVAVAQTTGACPHRRVVTLSSACGRRWLAFVSWVNPDSAMGTCGSRGRALVTLHDPSATQPALDPFIVAECFNFTPAEARVAIQIAAGANAKQIAQRMGTAVPTVRTHLQRVLEKTGVARQADLIRVLLALPSRTVL